MTTEIWGALGFGVLCVVNVLGIGKAYGMVKARLDAMDKRLDDLTKALGELKADNKEEFAAVISRSHALGNRINELLLFDSRLGKRAD